MKQENIILLNETDFRGADSIIQSNCPLRFIER